MPGMHLRQPGFTYSALDHLLKIKKLEKFKNLKKLEIKDKNEFDKTCFQDDMLMEILKIYPK